MEVRNGVTIHRVWKGLADAELLAIVMYPTIAERVCKALIAREQPGNALVYVNHYDGRMNIVRAPEAEGDER
jgi:hypothetical protein